MSGLPPKPDWFDTEIENIHRIDNLPLFKCVDGQSEMTWYNGRMMRKYGLSCWVVEALVPPSQLSKEVWDQYRYNDYEVNGRMQKVDVFGEYPVNGKYIHCLDIVDFKGDAIAPHRRVIAELKRRLADYTADRRTLEQRIKDDEIAGNAADEAQIKRIADNFHQKHGLAARAQFHNVAVGKPIK